MSIASALLPEFDHEGATTRALLALVPDAHGEWQPHPKSMSLGHLATHVRALGSIWVTMTVTRDALDFTRDDMPPLAFDGTADLLERFDRDRATSREQLAACSDEAMRAPWALRNDGATIFEMPRVVVLRSFCFNHLIHHRGQLSVYLRLLDVPLPNIYGPTADTAS